MAVHRESSNIPDRVPPQSVDLEMCVLGGVMLDPVEAYSLASEFLIPDSFYLEGHSLLFKLMGELSNRGIPPDMNAVLDDLRSRDLLDKVGGSGVVMGMLNSVPTAANVEYHSKKLAEKAALRNLIKRCTQIIDRAYTQEEAPGDILNYAAGLTADLAATFEGGGKADEAVELVAVLEQFMDGLSDDDEELKRRKDAGEKNPILARGVPTGFYDIDSATGGLRKNQLTIVGAQTSVGKTAYLLSLAYQTCVENNKSCLLISLEMDYEQLAERFLAMGSMHYTEQNYVAGVPTTVFNNPDLTNDQWSHLTASYVKLAESRIKLVDCFELTIPKLRAIVRQNPVDWVGVDYLQLMKAPNQPGPVQEIAEISRGLKRIAKEFRTPVVSLSQLKRPQQGKEDAKPRISDLHGGGSIGQDADNIILLYKEKGSEDVGGDLKEVKYILAKNRNGPTFENRFNFYPEITRFLNAGKQMEIGE